MRHLPGDAHFVAEAVERLRVVRRGLGQKLERDRLVERQVVGAINFAHAALSEQGDDAVAAAQQNAG